MSSAILEQAAIEAQRILFEVEGLHWTEEGTRGTRHHYRRVARAALSVALQPDETLVEAMNNALAAPDDDVRAKGMELILAAQRRAILGDD